MKTLHFFALATIFAASAACSAQVGSSDATGSDVQATHGAKGQPGSDGGSVGLACVIASSPAAGSANPAALYCAALGNQVSGDQCVFADGTSCEAFAFYRGECGGNHSFCNRHGGVVSNEIEDMGGWSASYARCTLPDGRTCKDESYAHTCVCNDAPAPTPTPGPLQTDAGPVVQDGGAACTALAPSGGSANPAAVYCTALGYQVANGQCQFPGGSTCDQWSFYRGECGGEFSFCDLHGGHVSNKTENMGTWTASYALCTLPGGQTCKDDDFAHSCQCN